MGKKKGSPYTMTKQMKMAAHLLAEGHAVKDIAIALFDCVQDENKALLDQHKQWRAVAKIRTWQKNPIFLEEYRNEITKFAMPTYGKALSVISKQMDDPNAWLANKAANDVLTRFAPVLLGEEDKKVTVQVVGMPTLGEPIPVEGVTVEHLTDGGD